MFRLALALICLALAATFNHAQTAQPTPAPASIDADDEVERVNVHLVSLPVNVTDRDGRFIADMRQDEFRVTENGVAQRISYFASAEQPFSVLLLIDTSGSTQIRLKDIQDAAIAFVNQLRPQDRVLPVAFDNDTVALLTEWTGDRARLTAAIQGAHTGMVREANDTSVVKGRDGKSITLRHVNTRLYDAVHKVSKELRAITGRKALILFTDGYDSASKLATGKSTLAEVEELDALIYVVQYEHYGNYNTRKTDGRGAAAPPLMTGQGSGKSVIVATTPGGGVQSENTAVRAVPGKPLPTMGPLVGPLGMPLAKDAEAKKYLESLAEKTGGRFYRADNLERIAQSFTLIADELRRMYSIGYHPTPLARPGERREVKVRVARERLSVRARKAYVFKPRN